MTKVTILGQSEPTKEKKKIEFVKFLEMRKLSFQDNNHEDAESPSGWKHIELITPKFLGGMDLMFAYDDNRRTQHCLYLGHFNDGEV